METKTEKPAVRTSGANRATKSGFLPTPIPRVQIQKLTVMLTETCNLDCWMCDFAKSKGLTKSLAMTPTELVELLQHPVFNRLSVITFTGGEPFAHPNVAQYYLLIKRSLGHVHVNFSSNSTLFARMLSVFKTVGDWRKVGLLVSIDGVTKHDLQRGTRGSLAKTIANLDRLREHFPDLSITLKFTITPVNYDEIHATYKWVSEKGYSMTMKMLEYNEFYTSKLKIASDQERFVFTPEQLDSIRAQLEAILCHVPRRSGPRRTAEIREVLDSLSPEWRRPGKCLTPTKGGFLDCDLNLFTCKEYAPVVNLRTSSLDELAAAPQLHEICLHERQNSGQCTRCTSQMKIQAGATNWLTYLKSLAG